MPDLTHTLRDCDLGMLRIIAGAWGIELKAPDAASALPLLVDGLHNQPLVHEVTDSLPADATAALIALVSEGGQMPWAVFTRRFGDLRPMGPGRRDRERPDLHPESTAEVLWYRALIGKAFFNVPPEPQEYAYIPDDLLDFLGHLQPDAPVPLGRPASPRECAQVISGSDHVLDDACTLLAALRNGIDLNQLDTSGWTLQPRVLKALLAAAGLLDNDGAPLPEPTRTFLEAPRAEALAQLVRAWLDSPYFNELLLMPDLEMGGEWRNDPLHTRQTVLEMLSNLPQNSWWNISAFISAVKERRPDYQRPAGDYDSWFLRHPGSETFLRGYSAWDEIDGALLRFIIGTIMPALGFFDLASPVGETTPAAFRPSRWAAALWSGSLPAGLPAENGQLRVSADAHVSAPPLTPRSARYLIARFCTWEGELNGEHRYRLTPQSMERAHKQGLKASHLAAVLRKFAAPPLPPNLLQAIDRLELLGTQARVEGVTLLRVTSPDILTALQKTRAARSLGEVLNPTTVIVRPGGGPAVLSALAEIGYLAEGLLEPTVKPGRRGGGQHGTGEV